MNSPFRWLFAIAFSIFTTLASAQNDLSLALTVANEQAAVFQNVTYTLTLTNGGPQKATNIVVTAPQEELNAQYGLVLSSVNASKGGFNLFNNSWTIDTLNANSSATLTLVLFALKPERPVFFAEVLSCSQSDPDSAPGNGDVALGAQEDDEVYRAVPNTTCELEISIAEDTCFAQGTPNAFYGYKLLVETSNPSILFIEMASNPSFISSTILPANSVYAPFSGWLYQSSGQSTTYYFRPYQSQGCVVEYEIVMPTSCSQSEPPPPATCILPNFFPDVYCVNNNSNLAITVSLQVAALYTSELTPTTGYRLLLDGVVIGTGTVQTIGYFGLNNAQIPISTEPVSLRLERLPDGKCISEYQITPSDFCPGSNTDFCPQQGIFAWDEWIKRVQFGNLNNPSGKSQQSNFTFINPSVPGNSASIVAGDSVPFNITVGYSYIAHNDFITMYLDQDRNGTFSQAELIYSGAVPAVPSAANAESILSGKVYIPADAQNGASTLKIVLRRDAPASVCGTVPYGEVELYNVRIAGGANAGSGCDQVSFEVLGVECNDNGTPNTPSDDTYYINYLFNQQGYAGTPTYSGAFWIDAGGNYQSPSIPLNFENQGVVGQPSRHGPISISQFPQLNFRVLGGFCNSDYVLVAAPTNTCSNQTIDPTANCAASSLFPWEDWISRFTVRSFIKNSGKAPYSDFTADQILLSTGANPISVRAAYSYLTFDEYVRIWVDFNQDDIFSADEIGFQGIIQRPANGVPFKDLSGQITVPNTALAGPTKMRVRMSRYDYADACADQGFGEVEDYTANLVINQGLQQSNPAQLPISIASTTGFYPNPASDKLYLHFPANSSATLTIRDAMGQQMLQKQFEQTNTIEELSLEPLMNGHYLLQIEVAGERQRTQVLVVAKDY